MSDHGIISQSFKSYSSIYRFIMTNKVCSVVSRYCLCVVLEALGQSEAAAECQIMALDLEATCLIVPFTVIPCLMQ